MASKTIGYAISRHGGGVGRLSVRLLNALLEWQDRANQRHRLRTMSDHMLKDMGLTRADVEHEASKPFWMA